MRIWIYMILPFMLACGVRPALQLDGSRVPNYGQLDLWAAHPDKIDSADLTPSSDFLDRQIEAEVDVFFLHPTTYTGDQGHKFWNAPISDAKLIKKTDETTIRHQASIFNASGRVYAPRYRQAHLHSYFTKKNPGEVKRAFELAYQDVKSAFQTYLDDYNEGRPIIIAAHSQGTTHGVRLIKEFFDGKPLGQKLVVTYLVGMPVGKRSFKTIAPCESAVDVNCFCSWRTFKAGYLPKKGVYGDSILVTNPLSWENTTTPVGKSQNKGGVLFKYHADPVPNLTDAQIQNGILWASKPKFPGSIFMTFRNYHIADYNLYWVNVRENAQQRVERFLRN